MRRSFHPVVLLTNRLSYTPEIQVLQIAQTAVDQPKGVMRCGVTKVTPFDQCNPQTPVGGVPCDTGTINSTADNNDVERILEF
jgi:hypothetical protein